jgi:transcription elongation GreA/GreB family factor
MAAKASYATCDESLENQLLAAADGDAASINALAELLRSAKPRQCSQWQENVRILWHSGLELVVERMDSKQLRSEESLLLLSMLEAEFDSPAMRDRYAALAKRAFNHYRDSLGLAAAIGIRNDTLSIAQVYQRWQVVAELKIGAYCYDGGSGVGSIVTIDDLANDVQMQFERRRTLSLSHFVDNVIVIKDLSLLHTLLTGKHGATLPALQEIKAALPTSLVAAAPIPADILKLVLVPAVLTEEAFARAKAADEEPNKTPAKAAAAAKTAAAAKKAAASATTADPQQWDQSRSIQELCERLKTVSSLKSDGELALDNVERILQQACIRADQSDLFAQCVAMLQKNAAELAPWLHTTVRTLAEQAVIWENPSTWAEITDKLPGKMAPSWFKITYVAKGSDFLAANTLQLPFRLWTQTEKLLAAGPDETLLADKVLQALESKHASADLLLWVWRSGSQELKDKYLADSHLLFKTLQVEVRGNYLRAQRDLRRLLLEDETFQRQVMLNGNREALVALVRCIKRLPLLDSGERQSLLVKIVRYFPEHIHEVEERRQTPPRRAVDKLTSQRSYQQRQEELNHLINVLVPANIAAIEHARSYGDLRENSEFKYAKEQQVFLATRRQELESSLNGTRATDFADVEVDDVAIPGSSITLRYDDDKEEVFHLLGLFDSVPEKNMVSYETPLGEVLMGCKPGMLLSMPSGDSARVLAIEPLSDEMRTWLANE